MDTAPASVQANTALYAERAPYILTLFVGALAWLVSYTVAWYEKVPVIAYSVAALPPSAKASGVVANFVATFTNISPAQAVDCAAIQLRAVGTKAGSNPPLAKGKVTLLTNSIVSLSLNEGDGAVVLQVVAMQPEAALRLQVSAEAANTLSVFTAPCVSEHGKQLAARLPILKEESLETLVLQRPLLLLWSGAVVWALALATLYGLSWMRRQECAPIINGAATAPIKPGSERLAAAPTPPSEGTSQ